MPPYLRIAYSMLMKADMKTAGVKNRPHNYVNMQFVIRHVNMIMWNRLTCSSSFCTLLTRETYTVTHPAVLFFTFIWPRCIVTNFFAIKPTDAPISQIYFVMKLYMFRTVRLSVISSLFTVHSAMVYVIQLSSRTRMELQFHPGPARKLSTNLHDIYHC
jgi:hypothetical protein